MNFPAMIENEKKRERDKKNVESIFVNEMNTYNWQVTNYHKQKHIR